MMTMKKNMVGLRAKIYNVERGKGQTRITDNWEMGRGIFVGTVLVDMTHVCRDTHR